jgi:hypothetical protein
VRLGITRPSNTESNVLHSELYCMSAGVCFWHGVFADSKEEEKCHDDEIRRCSGTHRVRGLVIGSGSFHGGNRER